MTLAAAVNEVGLSIPEATLKALDTYYALLLDESSRQNLTKLLSAQDFVEGHLIDCLELLKSGLLGESALDLGSGAGIPGLVCGILDPKCRWILSESEGKKAEFLQKAVDSLELAQIEVSARRAESLLKRDYSVESVVTRAVGSVGKIYGWIGGCSTWNNLILFKSKGWEAEWVRDRLALEKKLKISAIHEYTVGAERKYRIIVKLDRR
jgi:16S rRNA (guanine527-N7)-methyltransferase